MNTNNAVNPAYTRNISSWYALWFHENRSRLQTITDVIPNCPFSIVSYVNPSELVCGDYNKALTIVDTTRWCLTNLEKDDWYAIISIGKHKSAALRSGYDSLRENYVTAIIFKNDYDATMFKLMFYEYINYGEHTE